VWEEPLSATSADDDLIRSIQSQLEGLKKTPDGLFLYRLIDRGLQKRSGNYTGDTGLDFVNFLHGLLQRYARNPGGDTVTRVKVRLLQQRLAPHMMHQAPLSEVSVDDDGAQAGKPPDFANTGGVVEEVADASSGDTKSYTADNPEKDTVEPDTDSSTEGGESLEKTSEESGDAGVEAHSPELLEIDGLELDESAFDVSDESLQEIEFVDHDEDEIDFFNTIAEESSEPPPIEPEQGVADISNNEPGTAGEELSNDDQSGNVHSARIDSESTGSGHEIDIGDQLSMPQPLDIAKDDEGGSIDELPAVFETVEEPEEELAAVDFGDEFSFDLPEPDSGDVEDEVADAKAAHEEIAMPEDTKKSLATNPGTDADSARNPGRERVDRLHETFASKVAESISRNQEYTTLLRSNLKALKLADSPDDVLDIKHLLVRGLEDLLQGNETLNKDLGATNHYLKISKLDRNLLKDELGRIRDQSLVDDLTGTQNQKAFHKQIGAEIGRSKRYGFSLALALVVLDDFDLFREAQGNEVGNEVLRAFAQQVLAGFRGYDAVARLNDNQFGILFPNTQKEGALSALEKVQKCAADTVIQYDGRNIRLPTFTSSLTLYSPGDQPETMFKRIYDALALASENSRDKIIVALPQT
jgi:diguanylate cyclase (GGDEF)-like protein